MLTRTVSVSSQHAKTIWTNNSVDWFKLCNIRQSAFTRISGNMKVCSEFLFISIRINQA